MCIISLICFVVTGAAVEYEHPLSKMEVIDVNDSVQPNYTYLESQPNGNTVTGETEAKIKIIANPQENQPEVFDAVVLTMPVAQILQQKGLVQEVLGNSLCNVTGHSF